MRLRLGPGQGLGLGLGLGLGSGLGLDLLARHPALHALPHCERRLPLSRLGAGLDSAAVAREVGEDGRRGSLH